MTTIRPVRTLVLAGLAVFATCAPAPNPATGGGDAGGPAGPAGDATVHGGEARAPHDHQAMEAAMETASETGGPASERSLHLLPATWTDQHGEAVTLAELGGRVNVVAMVYTHCSFACPRIVAQMKAMEARLDEDPRVRFVLVSIDPERDTPERLADFARSTRLDPERWTVLRGSDDDVLTLSVLLGVKYQATGDGEFAHSNVLTVLDPGGVPVHRVEGLDADLDPAVEAVRRAMAGARLAGTAATAGHAAHTP